jgi:hypothetical protein
MSRMVRRMRVGLGVLCATLLMAQAARAQDEVVSVSRRAYGPNDVGRVVDANWNPVGRTSISVDVVTFAGPGIAREVRDSLAPGEATANASAFPSAAAMRRAEASGYIRVTDMETVYQVAPDSQIVAPDGSVGQFYIHAVLVGPRVSTTVLRQQRGRVGCGGERERGTGDLELGAQRTTAPWVPSSAHRRRGTTPRHRRCRRLARSPAQQRTREGGAGDLPSHTAQGLGEHARSNRTRRTGGGAADRRREHVRRLRPRHDQPLAADPPSCAVALLRTGATARPHPAGPARAHVHHHPRGTLGGRRGSQPPPSPMR